MAVVFFLAGIVAVALQLFALHAHAPAFTADAYSYIALADSIAKGLGYVSAYGDTLVPHTYYPPMFPILLAPLVKMFGMDGFFAMRIAESFCFAGVLVAVWVVLRDDFTGRVAWCCTAVSAYWVLSANQILSEIPCTLFLFLFFIAFERWRKGEISLVLPAVSFLCVYLTRTAFIAVLPAFACWSLERMISERRLPNRREVELGASLAVPVVAWWLWTQLTGGGGYTKMFAAGGIGKQEFVRGIFENIGVLTMNTIPSLVVGTNTGNTLWGLAVTALASVGFWRAWTKSRGLLEWTVPFYAAVLVLWPWTKTESHRFLLPFLPFVFLWTFDGAVIVFNRLQRARFSVREKIGVLLLCVAVTLVTGIPRIMRAKAYSESAGRAQEAVADWLKSHAMTDAILMSHNAPKWFVLSGLRGTYASPARRALGIGGLRELGADYVIVDRAMAEHEAVNKWLAACAHAHPELLTNVFEHDTIAVYKTRSDT